MELLTRTIAFPESLDEVAIAQFHDQVGAAIGSEATVMLVDFQNVEFTNSTGLMALVVAFRRAREADKKMLICSINEQVRMLLELTGMDQAFEVLENPVEVSSNLELLATVN